MSSEATSTSSPSLTPLPDGWEVCKNSLGQIFWTNSATRIKTYYHPGKPNPHPDGFAAIPFESDSLPEGWEVLGRTVDGRNDMVFLDHSTHSSTAVDPRLGPLSEGWTAGRTSSGRTFWTDTQHRIKTYYDPRKVNLHSNGFVPIPVDGDPLPEGWEVLGKEVDGKRVVVYLDHNTHSSTPENPRD